MPQDPPAPADRSITLVGIDEAGYGPLLGPLVVSATAFDVPASLLPEDDDAPAPDLWEILKESVARSPGRREPRIAVADSKKLHNTKSRGGDGFALLERAALAFLAQYGDIPVSLPGLLHRVAPDAVDLLDEYPWYNADALTLPVYGTRDALLAQSNALAGDLARTGVRFRGAWVELLPEGHYNRLVGTTRNKAVVLFGQTIRLVQRVQRAAPNRQLHIWVDRQGGRVGYRRPLMTAFDDAELQILEESPERSSYRLVRRAAPWVVRFCKNGETHSLPIALASVLSKYTRELMMTCFNRYFAERVPGLKPTAGYYQDGQRFLQDIESCLATEQIDRRILVRIS